MASPDVSSNLARLQALLARALAETTKKWVAVSIEVRKGGARRLLDLNESDETAYFVSGRGSSDSTLLEDGATFVGLGAIASRRFEGPERLSSAVAFVRETFVAGSLPEELATVVRCFGGASFSPGRDGSGNCWEEFGDARFVLPRCLYVDDESMPERPARLVCLAQHADLTSTLALAERLLLELEKEPLAPARQRPSTLKREESEELASWTRLVEGIKAEIGQGTVKKVVAARRVTLQLSEAPRPADILERLNESAPLCARFCLRVGRKTFLGATPERLVKRTGRSVVTEALAGSISAAAPNADITLLQSDKDRREHAYVIDAICEALRPLCETLEAPTEPEVRHLQAIYHLRTPVRATLASDVHILDLVARLHPTPAVGGLPRERALEFITFHERAERGWYAAPVGWIDSAGNGEFVVALRSSLIAGDKVHVYAGAGIVEGSDSSSEYAETELKLGGMLGALGLTSLEPCALGVRAARDERVHS